MPDKAWKAYERRIALRFGGKRRGAYTGANGQGKCDVIATGYAVECKLLARPSFQQMLDAAQQAERNAESELDIPLAIVKRKGDQDKNAIVVMRLDTFMDHFGPSMPIPEELEPIVDLVPAMAASINDLTYAHRSE